MGVVISFLDLLQLVILIIKKGREEKTKLFAHFLSRPLYPWVIHYVHCGRYKDLSPPPPIWRLASIINEIRNLVLVNVSFVHVRT